MAMIVTNRGEAGDAMNSPPVFVAANAVMKACKYCAALGIVPKQISQIPQLLNAGIDNGTLSFIKYGGEQYGVTCKHVVESVRGRNEKYGAGAYLLATLTEGTFAIGDEFHFPSAAAGSHAAPDIAITRLPADFRRQSVRNRSS